MALCSKIFMAFILGASLATPSYGQDEIWTAIIPRGFPGFAYTWRLDPDGSYRENGRDMRTGHSIEPTLFGHWRMTGKHMVLRQDGIQYVFDGDTFGNEYLGTLYLDGKRFSHFCAIKGNSPPQSCPEMSA